MCDYEQSQEIVLYILTPQQFTKYDENRYADYNNITW